MQHRRAVALVVGAALMLSLAACSTTPSAPAPTTTTSTQGGSTSTSGASSPNGARNLTVTDALRQQLVAAGAALNQIPASEYSGLTPGLTYYALDSATGEYWAAGQLVPAPSSDPNTPTQAQIASQDDGSYTLFTRSAGGSWMAYSDGFVGPGTSCPLTVPPSVVQVWGWTTGTCRPPANP